jgi:hypothetical protein
MMRNLILLGVAVALCLSFGLAHCGKSKVMSVVSLKDEYPLTRETQQGSTVLDSERGHAEMDSLPALDAHGVEGIREIARPELVKVITKFRLLSQDESANLDRGCLGLTCVYQGLGLTRWPELAHGTVAYLSLKDALNHRCLNGEENFVFLKQGWWLAGSPPTPNPTTAQVPVNSVTRMKPGLYTFNYAVYFPSTATYAWINHRDYGFPINLIKPQKAFLSLSPPPLTAARPAQIYCSTCR